MSFELLHQELDVLEFKQMTKTTKRIMFYSAVAVFLALSYIISLYAQGYRYNFTERRFVRTGAIYLKANTDADVFLDNKLVGSTTFIGNSYLINNLLPGVYEVKLSKNNFFQWQKKILVEEGLVNEFSRILLLSKNNEEAEHLKKELAEIMKSVAIPETAVKERFFIKNKTLFKNLEPKPEKIADNVLGFSLSGGENKLLWWGANELWIMWLSDADYQPYKKENERELITRFSARIKTAAWFKGGDHIAVDLGNNQNPVYNIVETDKRGGINIIEI